MSSKKKDEVSLVPAGPKRGPGRPRKVKFEPISEEVRQLMANRREAVANDGLLLALLENPDSMEVFDKALLKLASETAVLEFEREEAARNGEDITTLSKSIMQGSKTVLDNWVKRRDFNSKNAIDPESPAVQKLFSFFLEKIVKVCENQSLSQEALVALLGDIAEAFEGWEDEIEDLLRQG